MSATGHLVAASGCPWSACSRRGARRCRGRPASTRNLEQLTGLLALNDLRLTSEETARLDEASA